MILNLTKGLRLDYVYHLDSETTKRVPSTYMRGYREFRSRSRGWDKIFVAQRSEHWGDAQRKPDVVMQIADDAAALAYWEVRMPMRAALRWLKHSNIRVVTRRRKGKDPFCERVSWSTLRAIVLGATA